MFRPRIDPCILLLLTTVAVASLLPARGIVAVECTHVTTLERGQGDSPWDARKRVFTDQ